MATVTRENIGTLHDKITVKLSKEDYWPSFEKSLKQFAKQANVPGFRKGMVPAGMIRKMYGQSIFGDEVIRTAGRELEDYLKKENLKIFAQPMITANEEKINLDMNQPAEVDFSFEIGLKPDFEIPALNGATTLNRYKIIISDSMLEDEINRLRRRMGKQEDQEALSGTDDILYITYEACDEAGNVAEETEKKENVELLRKMPEKLQQQLQGIKVGESLVFKPADIAEGEELHEFLKDALKENPEAAGQPYKLTLAKIKTLIPEEMNAEFFAKVFPQDFISTEEEFRNRLRSELSEQFDRISRDRLQNEIYEMLVHNTPIQLPADFLKRWLKEGQEKKKTDAEVEKEFPSLEHQLRWTLISDKLISENDIQVSFDEVKEDIKGRVLSYFGMEDDEEAPWMESYMTKVVKDEKMVDETYRRMRFARLFDWLETQFRIEEKEIGEEEFFKLTSPHQAHHHHH